MENQKKIDIIDGFEQTLKVFPDAMFFKEGEEYWCRINSSHFRPEFLKGLEEFLEERKKGHNQ